MELLTDLAARVAALEAELAELRAQPQPESHPFHAE